MVEVGLADLEEVVDVRRAHLATVNSCISSSGYSSFTTAVTVVLLPHFY